MKKRTRYNAQMPSATYDLRDYEVLRASQTPATLIEEPGMRFDSAEDASVFFARELDFIKAQTYDVLYPEFTALKLFPASSEVDIGAMTVTFYGYDKSGMAKIIQNYADDLPRVDVMGEPTTSHIKSIGDSYGYSVQEMRSSRMAGKSLDVRKAETARYIIDRELNRIAWAGDEKNNLIGVLSLNNDVPLFTLPLNAAGTSTKFVDKTPNECLNDIKAMVAYTATLTKSVEQPDTLALPTDAYLYLANTPRSDYSDLSILNWILANVSRLKEIIEAPELNADSMITPYGDTVDSMGAVTPGQGVAFMFKKDPMKFTIENPLPFYQHPIQPRGLEFMIPCECRTAGAIIYYPLSMLITVGV
jgi:hypothetical protein